MDDTKEEEVPPYEQAGDAAPSYSAEAPHPAGLTLTLDPTATLIKKLSSPDTPALYTLNKPLLHVTSTTSIHIKSTATESTYAIAEHWVSPLPPLSKGQKAFQNVTASRSHGALVTLGGREKVWDFSACVPAPSGSARDSNVPMGTLDPL